MKYEIGDRFTCNGCVGVVVPNYKLPGDICVEWDSGQKSSYDQDWLDDNVEPECQT